MSPNILAPKAAYPPRLPRGSNRNSKEHHAPRSITTVTAAIHQKRLKKQSPHLIGENKNTRTDSNGQEMKKKQWRSPSPKRVVTANIGAAIRRHYQRQPYSHYQPRNSLQPKEQQRETPSPAQSPAPASVPAAATNSSSRIRATPPSGCRNASYLDVSLLQPLPAPRLTFSARIAILILVWRTL